MHYEDCQIFFVTEGEAERGPFSINKLEEMRSDGQVTDDTLYAPEGAPEWKPLRELLKPRAVITTPRIPERPILRQEVPVITYVAKNRGVYIIMAIVTGFLGFHNFYAGHLKSGAAQLLLTILWIPLSVISGISILILLIPVALFILIIGEILLVKKDGNGIPMA